jgi:hypothetical protein
VSVCRSSTWDMNQYSNMYVLLTGHKNVVISVRRSNIIKSTSGRSLLRSVVAHLTTTYRSDRFTGVGSVDQVSVSLFPNRPKTSLELTTTLESLQSEHLARSKTMSSFTKHPLILVQFHHYIQIHLQSYSQILVLYPLVYLASSLFHYGSGSLARLDVGANVAHGFSPSAEASRSLLLCLYLRHSMPHVSRDKAEGQTFYVIFSHMQLKSPAISIDHARPSRSSKSLFMGSCLTQI